MPLKLVTNSVSLHVTCPSRSKSTSKLAVMFSSIVARHRLRHSSSATDDVFIKFHFPSPLRAASEPLPQTSKPSRLPPSFCLAKLLVTQVEPLLWGFRNCVIPQNFKEVPPPRFQSPPFEVVAVVKVPPPHPSSSLRPQKLLTVSVSSSVQAAIGHYPRPRVQFVVARRISELTALLVVKVMYEADRRGVRRIREGHLRMSSFNASAQCLCCFRFEDFNLRLNKLQIYCQPKNYYLFANIEAELRGFNVVTVKTKKKSLSHERLIN
uniref:Uncharacterized protein n=1 Tax=Cucumis melo TaxID=3656 RepID=A0A9I9EM98_CUCME